MQYSSARRFGKSSRGNVTSKGFSSPTPFGNILNEPSSSSDTAICSPLFSFRFSTHGLGRDSVKLPPFIFCSFLTSTLFSSLKNKRVYKLYKLWLENIFFSQ